MTREDIVAEACTWLGTPYCHQASLKGAGCDCLGLVRGIWRNLIGREPEAPPPYTPDWAEALGEEMLIDAVRQHFVELRPGTEGAGDVVIFRMERRVPAKHCGVISAPGRMIHAYWGRGVSNTRLTPWWTRRVAAAFAYPGLED